MRSICFLVMFSGSVGLIGVLGTDRLRSAQVRHANPVVRMLAPAGVIGSATDWNDGDTGRSLSRMIALLEARRQPVPEYLTLVAKEYATNPRATASFAVGCYWEGERDLGKVKGIVSTRTGMIGPDEVVQAEYDPAAVDFGALVSGMKRKACFRKVYAHSDQQKRIASGLTDAVEKPADNLRLAEQQQFYLSQHPEYHYLPLTAAQATKLNAALASGNDADRFLAPRQKAMRQRMSKLLARHRSAADRLADLRPDRSPAGLPAYVQEIEGRLGVLERYYP